MSDYADILPLPGQQKFTNCIEKFTDVTYFFFITGYGAGKSFEIILLILLFSHKYFDVPLNIGIGGITFDKIQKFILDDLFKILIIRNIQYKWNSQKHILKIGSLTFYCIPVESPELIYGFNLDIFLVDEIDELKIEVCLKSLKAIAERTRKKTIEKLLNRPPFMCFFTTMQGKRRGIYLKREELKKQNVKCCVIRASTKQNHHNSKSYYDGLAAIYTEDERRAFLEGQDVDFVTGLVYPEFNENRHIIESFEILPTDELYIGQDLNLGYSRAIAMIIRDNKIYIINNWSFENIGNAPNIIRNAYPNNDIYLYPDSSGKMIMQGYKSEFESANINVMQGVTNPSILTRIFYVNKLFKTDRMFIFKGNDPLVLDLMTRGFDKSGQPEKGGGEKDPSHRCDSLEYGIFRIVQSKPAFWDLKNAIKG